MLRLKLFPALALACCLLSANAFAQDAQAMTTPANGSAPTERQREAKEGALKMLDNSISESQGLRVEENKVRNQAVAARLLWRHDEKRARELFRNLLNQLAASLNALNAIPPGNAQQTQDAQQSIYRQLTLRQAILRTIAERDPSLALELLRATRSQVAPTTTPNPNAETVDNSERELEVTLAKEIAARDPQRALKLAEESLQKGISYEAVNIVAEIAKQDRAAAQGFIVKLLARIRRDGFEDDAAMGVAQQLLTRTRVGSEPAAQRNGATAKARPEYLSMIYVDEATRRQIVADISAELVEGMRKATEEQQDRYQSLLFTVRALMPEVERFAPNESAWLKQRVAESTRGLSQLERGVRESQMQMQQLQTLPFEEALKVAGRAAPDTREMYFGQLFWRAMQEGETAMARRIATDHIANKEQRDSMLEMVERSELTDEAAQGNIEGAQQRMARIDASGDDKLNLQIELARAASKKGDRKTVARLVEEMRPQLTGRAASMSQLEARLRVAALYADFAPERGFDVVEDTISQLNELLAAALVLNGFTQDAFRDGELDLQDGQMWSEILKTCGETLAALAAKDFTRARNASDRFDRAETRATAHLYIAMGTLEPAANIPLLESASAGHGENY